MVSELSKQVSVGAINFSEVVTPIVTEINTGVDSIIGCINSIVENTKGISSIIDNMSTIAENTIGVNRNSSIDLGGIESRLDKIINKIPSSIASQNVSGESKVVDAVTGVAPIYWGSIYNNHFIKMEEQLDEIAQNTKRNAFSWIDTIASVVATYAVFSEKNKDSKFADQIYKRFKKPKSTGLAAGAVDAAGEASGTTNSGIWSSIKGAGSSALQWVKGAGSSAWQWGKGALPLAWQGIKDFFINLVKGIGGLLVKFLAMALLLAAAGIAIAAGLAKLLTYLDKKHDEKKELEKSSTAGTMNGTTTQSTYNRTIKAMQYTDSINKAPTVVRTVATNDIKSYTNLAYANTSTNKDSIYSFNYNDGNEIKNNATKSNLSKLVESKSESSDDYNTTINNKFYMQITKEVDYEEVARYVINEMTRGFKNAHKIKVNEIVTL